MYCLLLCLLNKTASLLHQVSFINSFLHQRQEVEVVSILGNPLDDRIISGNCIEPPTNFPITDLCGGDPMAFPHLERLPQVCSILCHTLLSYSLGRLGENLCLESNICHAIWLTHLRASISPALGDSCTKSLKRNFVY